MMRKAETCEDRHKLEKTEVIAWTEPPKRQIAYGFYSILPLTVVMQTESRKITVSFEGHMKAQRFLKTQPHREEICLIFILALAF